MALPDYEDFQPELASDDDNGVVVKSPETPPLSPLSRASAIQSSVFVCLRR
jgi:hypothetical protein